jgi:multimeric flavodoxin WrbA
MNITILNGSHRADGNTYRFCLYAKEVLEKKHDVVIFDLIHEKIEPCQGCLRCEDGEDCQLHDDYSDKIRPALQNADLIIFAAPVYFNMPSSAMVNLLDRTNDLCSFFSGNHKKGLIFMVGQTDAESITDTCKCLKTYCEIMGIEEIQEPFISVGRLKNDCEFETYKKLLQTI